MTANVQVVSNENGRSVKVTKSGEMVVAPLAYSDTKFNLLDATATAYHYYPPLSGKQFVISCVLVFGDKEIANASDTTIEIYEAASTTETTVSKVLMTFGLGQLTSLAITPLNILVNPGVYVNAKTDDDDVYLTIMGYYIEELD